MPSLLLIFTTKGFLDFGKIFKPNITYNMSKTTTFNVYHDTQPDEAVDKVTAALKEIGAPVKIEADSEVGDYLRYTATLTADEPQPDFKPRSFKTDGDWRPDEVVSEIRQAIRQAGLDITSEDDEENDTTTYTVVKKQ